MWIQLLLPIFLELFAKCREDREAESIVEGLKNPGRVEKGVIRVSVRKKAKAEGWTDGMSRKERRRWLKNAEKEAYADFKRISPERLASMVDVAEASREARG